MRLPRSKTYAAVLLQKISMFLLASYPVLCVYAFGNTKFSLAIVCSIIVLVLSIIFRGISTNGQLLPIAYLFLWAYMSINTYLITGISGWSDYLPGGIDFILFTLSIIGFVVNFNLDYFFKYLKLIFIVSAFLFIIQLIIFVLTNVKISFLLPLSNNLLYCDLPYSELVKMHQQISGRFIVERFSSIFCEPSYFAQFSLFVLCTELFYKNNKNKLFTPFSVFIAIIIILTNSGGGILGLLFLAIIKLIYIIFITRKAKYYLFLVCMAPIIVYCATLYLSTSSGMIISERVAEIDGTAGENSSGFFRVVLGWNVYGQLSFSDKICGVPRSVMQYYWDGGFFNGVTSLLCSKGLIGFTLWIVSYLSAVNKHDVLCVVVLLLFLIISLLESTYLGGLMMITSSIVFGSYYQRVNNY